MKRTCAKSLFGMIAATHKSVLLWHGSLVLSSIWGKKKRHFHFIFIQVSTVICTSSSAILPNLDLEDGWKWNEYIWQEPHTFGRFLANHFNAHLMLTHHSTSYPQGKNVKCGIMWWERGSPEITLDWIDVCVQDDGAVRLNFAWGKLLTGCSDIYADNSVVVNNDCGSQVIQLLIEHFAVISSPRLPLYPLGIPSTYI